VLLILARDFIFFVEAITGIGTVTNITTQELMRIYIYIYIYIY
jgi:hypothetical protein